MAKISVYLNAQASQNGALFSAEELKKFFFRHELAIRTPQDLAHLKKQLDTDLEDGVEYIFSVGGDGTANTISQNLIGKNVKLMVLPAGTANDFAKEMGISSSLKKVSQIFNAQTTTKIDAIKVNDRYMITNGGIGMASEVARTVDKMRQSSPLFKRMMKTLGKETYSLVYAQKMLASPFSAKKILIESKDSPLLDPRIASPLILINNQAIIGGKFNVAPGTRNDDGKFNVTIFKHKNKIDFMKCTLLMMQGIYPKNDPNLVSFETDRVILNSLENKPLEFFGDGEIFSDSKILDISIAPRALEVCSYKGESIFCASHSLDDIDFIQ